MLYPLPELILFSDYNGNWDEYSKEIYNIFIEQIVNGKLSFLEKPIKCKFTPSTENKFYTFGHLIQKGENKNSTENDRIPDMKRCERILWIPHIIKNANNPEIYCWENNRNKNDTHFALWLKKENYIIVLAKRKGYFLLKTAYEHEEKYGIYRLERDMKKYLDPRKS